MRRSNIFHGIIPVLLPLLVGAAPPFDGTDLLAPKRTVQGTVDQAAGAGEYSATGTISAGLGSFQVQSYRSVDGTDEEIQLLFNITDNTTSNNDLIRVYFDTNHNHTRDDGDRELQIERSGSAVVGGVNLSGAPSSPIAVPGGQVSVGSNATGWVAEVKLEASDLGLNGIPSLVGLFVYVFDSNTFNEGRFPDVVTSSVGSWTNLKTRHPIDFVIALDQSGSMLSQDKWTSAKRAADFFANTMAALGDPTYFADRIGLVTFSWLCSGGDQTTLEKPLGAVGAFPVGTYTTGVGDPQPNFCTPIGEGLAEAFAALKASQSDESVQKERGVLLLSDGLQNRPDPTFTPASTGYDPCPAEADFNPCPADTDSNVPVSTVAFGEGDWQVDTDLLSAIRGRYMGAFATTYDLTPDVEELKESFINGLEDFYTTNLVYSGAPAAFPLVAGNDKLVVIASWTDPTEAEDIGVERNDTAQSCDESSRSTAVGFAICVVKAPAGGSWEAVAADGTFNHSPDRIFAVIDLRLRARFGVGPVQPGTGDPLLLTAELKDRGRPVLHDPGAHPVRVRVSIETPEEGVGTFASTHEPRTCETIRPMLPKPGVVISAAAAGPRAASVATRAGVAQQGGDPDPPLYQHVQSLLDACNRTGLARDRDSGLELRDDGTQGDAVANDGIYSLRLAPADVAGTYVFRFDVDGTTAEGEPFARTRRLASYVRVKPDLPSSDFGSRVIEQVGNVVVREFYLVPRDRFGGYLGPGRAQHVDFVRVRGPGAFVGGVIDYGNGYYARKIRYDRTRGEPVVVPEVYGEPVRPRRPGAGGRRPLGLGLFAGATLFDDNLGLDDGPVLGARASFRGIGPIAVELEGAVTNTEDAAGTSGRVVQGFGNLRLDLPRVSRVSLFATAGVGVVSFRDFGTDEEALAVQGGGGLHFWLSRNVAIRGDVRLLRFDEVRGVEDATSYQATAGLVFRP